MKQGKGRSGLDVKNVDDKQLVVAKSNKSVAPLSRDKPWVLEAARVRRQTISPTFGRRHPAMALKAQEYRWSGTIDNVPKSFEDKSQDAQQGQ